MLADFCIFEKITVSMEDLVYKITAQTGIDKEKAAIIVGIVSNDLKLKFPTFLHPEIDSVLNGGKFGDTYRERLDDVKEKIEDAAKKFGHQAERAMNEIKEKLNEMFTNKKTPPQS
jgi:hypothetical protein